MSAARYSGEPRREGRPPEAGEAARAEERETTFGLLEAQASANYQQSAELRRFADAKVDELRDEFSVAAQANSDPKGNYVKSHRRAANCVRETRAW